MLSRLKNIGPGAMVAAAFIGPGTVTTATVSGTSFGYTLLWAVFFSIIATIILQEMSARLGVVGKMGIGQAIRKKTSGLARIIISLLVIAAIFIGNAAYEAGNISGVAVGANLFPEVKISGTFIIPLIVGGFAGILLYTGRYKVIEKFLVALVALMGISFLVAAIMSDIDFGSALKGLFIPTIPKDATINVVSLIGTTVVPYNLFLHASSASQKWQKADELRDARYDTMLSIGLGGLITMAIMIIAASAIPEGGGIIEGFEDNKLIALTSGNTSSQYFVGIGFLIAGFSSAITAPLAAAFAFTEIVGREKNMKSIQFRTVWIIVLMTGIGLAIFPDYKPESIIIFAQFTNGIILPLIAILLVWIMNDPNLLGVHKNKLTQNILGTLIIIITLVLGLKGIMSALGVL